MVAKRLAQHFPRLQSAQTTGAGHATRLTRQALERGAQMVLAFGGDGTINEVLAGFVDENGHNAFPNAVLGVVAAGSGSDFQRLFGRRGLIEQIDAFAQSQPRKIDYGVAQMQGEDGLPVHRAFLNIASAGISGEVVHRMASNERSATGGATQRYLSATLTSLLSHRGIPAEICIDDGEVRRVNLNLACICNGQFFGSGMQISPNSEIDDGYFHLIEAKNLNRIKIATLLARVYGGKHLRSPGIQELKAKRVSVKPIHRERKIALELDGEAFGHLPATFELRSRALWIQTAE